MIPRRRLPALRRTGVRAALAALLALLPHPLRAAPAGEQSTWAVEDSEEVRSRVAEAERLLGRGLPERALPLLQEVIDRFPDHLVRNPEEGMLFEGARAFVLRKIRGLTPAARRAYQEAYGPEAARLLARALRSGEPKALEEVADRYLLAGPAAPRALLALADLRRARGEEGRAAAPLRLLLREFAGTPWAGPETIGRLAGALASAGNRRELEDLAASASARGEASVAVDGGTAPLASILADALARAGPPERSGEAATLGGGPRRAGDGSFPESLGRPRWKVSNPRFRWTTLDGTQARMESSVQEALLASQPIVPAIVDGVIYLHWSHDLLARDLYTGRTRWRFQVPSMPRQDSARTHGALLLSPAVADGVVYAPLEVWPPGENPQTVTFASQVIIPHLPKRRLFAVEAATGEMLWTHADPRPRGDPFSSDPGAAGPLRDIDVTGAPLVVGDLVVSCGATYSGRFSAWVFAADRRTGTVRWWTRLGYGQQELNLFGRPVKEVPCAAVASDGSRAFVLTNLGVISCVDLDTGGVLWSRGYRQVEMPYYENFWSTPQRRLTWTGSAPILAGDLLLAAPADGPELLALDAGTGRLRWAHPAREGLQYNSPRMTRLLAADDRRCYLGGTSVRALDLATGKIAWARGDAHFDGTRDREECSGRGVLAGERLLVPSTRALYFLDAATGKRIRKEPFRGASAPENWGEEGGNLVTADGAAVISRLETMEAYYDPGNVGARAQALLRARPRDPDALLEAARIYLAADQVEEAVPLLERALEAAETLGEPDRGRKQREARAGIFQVQLRRAEAFLSAHDGRGAAEAFRRAAAHAPDPGSAVRALLRAAVVLHDSDSLDRAAALLEEIVAREPDAVLGEEEVLESGSEAPSTAASYALWYLAVWYDAGGRPGPAVETLHRIFRRPRGDLLFGGSAREFARQFVDQIARREGAAVFAPFEREAAAAFEEAARARDPEALGRVSTWWPNASVAVRAALEQARLRLEAGDAGAAVEAARRLLGSRPEPDIAAAALWLLAEGLARSGRIEAARGTLERLARRHPAAELETGEGREVAATAVARRLDSPDLRPTGGGPAALPLEGPFRTLWEREIAAEDPRRLLDPTGGPLPGGLLLLRNYDSLEAVEARTGRERWKEARSEFRGIPAAAGGLLVFAVGERALGVDPADGREIWKASLPGPLRDLAVSDSLPILLLEDRASPDDGVLTALDPQTGIPAWDQPRTLRNGATGLHALPEAILVDSSGTFAPHLRVVEAADGTPRPYFIPLRRGDEPSATVVPVPEGPLVLRRDTALEAYDLQSGVRLWDLPLGEGPAIQSTAAGPGVVAFQDTEETLRALDPATGAVRWTLPRRADRLLDPSETALLADGSAVYTVSLDREKREDVRVEAWSAADGRPLWSRPVSRAPALVEISGAPGALLVKFLPAGAGGGETGVVVLDRREGGIVDRFVDRRLAGGPFEAVARGGVLVVANERVVLARGR